MLSNYKVYIDTDLRYISGGVAESNERYSNRSTEYNKFVVNGVYSKSKDGQVVEQRSVTFDPSVVKQVFLVVVIHSTGDSFGRSEGHGHVEGVYASRDEAVAIAKAIRTGCGNYGKARGDDRYKDYQTLKGLNKEKWFGVPWDGYFERVESIKVMPWTMDTGSASEEEF
jgi:hypothetical protein